MAMLRTCLRRRSLIVTPFRPPPSPNPPIPPLWDFLHAPALPPQGNPAAGRSPHAPRLQVSLDCFLATGGMAGLGISCRRFSSLVLAAQASALDYSAVDEDRVSSTLTKPGRPEKAAGKPASDDAESLKKAGRPISDLGICQEIVDALAKREITHLFPIQNAVLEPAMKGCDLIGRAKTGTGKTLAFGIPILDNIIKERTKKKSLYGRVPLALVLAPTRELAKQVENEFKDTGPTLKTVCVYGGVSIQMQQRQLESGVDIAVGTPGRIIDLLERNSLNLGEVRFLVLDEADQMLAIGFAEAVENILKHLPVERQSMLFSATMPNWVKSLSRKYLKNPTVIDLVGEHDKKLAEGIKLFSVSATNSVKGSVLKDLVTVYGKGGKTIVFTQTKRDASDVAFSMNKAHGSEALHGDITQFQREKTLDAFRDGRITVLVATDVAARGIDVPNVDLVIHYEAPNDSEIFVHRSGRTGRAGKEGIAILMHTEHQMHILRSIERDIGCKFQTVPPPSVKQVLVSTSDQAALTIKNVHPSLKSIFLPSAQKLLQEEGPEALAAAIASICGFKEPPPSRSLLTHEQGWMTVRMIRSGSLPSTRAVIMALAKVLPDSVNKVSRIHMLYDGNGAVFDLREEVAKKLLELNVNTGDTFDAPEQLPKIVRDMQPSERYGRAFPVRGESYNGRGFGSGGGYGRSGGFGGGRGYGRFDSGSSGRYGRESGFFRAGQSSGGYGGGSSYGGKPSGGRFGGSRFGDDTRSRRFGGRDGYDMGSSHSSKTSGSDGTDRRSSRCLLCGLSGHRASECPRRK